MTTALQYDHLVTTADGTICRVTYVDKQRKEAYVKPIEGDRYGSEITLPLAELTRIADPRNKLPPIEGLPKTRPVCQYCKTKLRPSTNNSYDLENKQILAPRVTRRVFSFWHGYGYSKETYTTDGGKTRFYVPLFHSTKCAIKFAQASWLGGMRMPG